MRVIISCGVTETDGYLAVPAGLLNVAGRCKRRVIPPYFLTIPMSRVKVLPLDSCRALNGCGGPQAHTILILNPAETLDEGQFAAWRVSILFVMLLDVDTAALYHLRTLSVQSKQITVVYSLPTKGGDNDEEGFGIWLLFDWRR